MRFALCALLIALCAATSDLHAQDDADSALQMGFSLLERNQPDSAEAAFDRAIDLGAKAAGLNGMGKVMEAKGRSYYRQAFKFYRRALGADKTYLEAQLSISRLHAFLRDRDTKGAYRKAIKMAPERPEPYIELANFLVDTQGRDSGPEVEKLLTAYMEREPSDPDGYVLWMESLADRAMIREIRNVSGFLIEKFPEETRFLPAIALAEASAGQVDLAMDYWGRFIDASAEDEKALYDDLSLVADPSVVEAYAPLAGDERETFLTDFWRDRDATSGLSGVGARAEHYRRVWYSIRNFSSGKAPWDRRGEVYIRYGDPDYRSRSGYPNPPPSGAAELVRDRLYNEIGFGELSNASDRLSLDRVFGEQRERDASSLGAPPQQPVYPIMGLGDAKWESWIYTRIGGGVEFVFVDLALNGEFQFPKPPDGFRLPMKVLAKLTELHPGTVYESVSNEEPQYYDFPFGYVPLDFYYDLATFRGGAGRTRLEVYFGVPTEHLKRGKTRDGQLIHAVERTLTLKGDDAFRKNEVAGYAAPEGQPDRTLVELATLEVPAGTYRMNVEVLDRASGRWGVYSQEIVVPEYPDSLTLSDLSLAWSVSATKTDDRFRKHIEGLDPETDVWVIPLPSRSYRQGNALPIYYEIYNLQRNEFGQTSYEVKYTVDQQIRRGAGVFGAMATMFRRAAADREPQLSIAYDATGETTAEPVYLEMETKELKAGYNRITVTVTDRVSGQSASKEAILRLVE